MRIFGIAFSGQGTALLERLQDLLSEDDLTAVSRYEGRGIARIESSKAYIKAHFQEPEAWIFVGSCGMTVRLIADQLRDKAQDPAVIVLDEQGRFVIPLLSGHLGGANALAVRLAEILQAEPVITTATDTHGLFAVDDWARRQHLTVADPKMILPVSRELLQGREVALKTEVPIAGERPQGLTTSCTEDTGIFLHRGPAASAGTPFKETLELILQEYIIGIGCKKGIEPELLECKVRKQLQDLNIGPEQVYAVATIDIKKEETALVRLARSFHVPLLTYSAETLAQVPGEFSHSDFVLKTVGVDNVCERAAMVQGSDLILRKTADSGITVAVSRRNRSISYE